MVLCSLLLCLSGFSPVVSYAAENYFYIENPRISYIGSDWDVLLDSQLKQYDDNTGYYTFGSSSFNNVKSFAFGNSIVYSEIMQYLPDVYDYYVVLTAYSNCSVSEFTFKPSLVDIVYDNCDGSPTHRINDISYYHHDKKNAPYTGFTITFKLPEANSTSISYLTMIDEGTATVPSTDMNIRIEIINVEKNQSLGSMDIIADHLKEINDSIIDYGNKLHQDMDELKDGIENQYSVTDEENFGVADIIDQVNEKAGVLAVGTTTLVNFLDLFDSSNAGSTQLTFPGFSMQIQGTSYQIWNDVHYDLSELDTHFGGLMEVVRWATTMVVYMAVLNYLVHAFDEIFGSK